MTFASSKKSLVFFLATTAVGLLLRSKPIGVAIAIFGAGCSIFNMYNLYFKKSKLYQPELPGEYFSNLSSNADDSSPAIINTDDIIEEEEKNRSSGISLPSFLRTNVNPYESDEHANGSTHDYDGFDAVPLFDHTPEINDNKGVMRYFTLTYWRGGGNVGNERS